MYVHVYWMYYYISYLLPCVIVTIRGANLDSACWRMFRPLHRAAVSGDASIVQVLLTMGAAPNEVDINKYD